MGLHVSTPTPYTHINPLPHPHRWRRPTKPLRWPDISTTGASLSLYVYVYVPVPVSLPSLSLATNPLSPFLNSDDDSESDADAETDEDSHSHTHSHSHELAADDEDTSLSPRGQGQKKRETKSRKAAADTSAVLMPVGEGESSSLSYVSLGEPVKAMLHFVRRRRLLRWQCFDPLRLLGVPIADLPCAHCDLAAIDDVSAMLLATLATASVTAHPRAFNESKCNALKNKLLAVLRLDCSHEEHIQKMLRGSQLQDEAEYASVSIDGISVQAKTVPPRSPVQRQFVGRQPDKPKVGEGAAKTAEEPATATAPETQKEGEESKSSGSAASSPRARARSSSGASTSTSTSTSSPRSDKELALVKYSLRGLVESLLRPFLESVGGAGSTLSGLLQKETSSELHGRRMADIEHSFFAMSERKMVAECIIRRHDIPGQATTGGVVDPTKPLLGTGYNFHCNVVNCGSSCEFAHQMCPNRRCDVRYSVRDHDMHQAECGYAVVECPRACGDPGVLRKELHSHMESSCPHRPAGCPFNELGCMASLMAVKVPHHLEECATAHLMQLLNRVVEQQSVIKTLHKDARDAKLLAEHTSEALVAALVEIGALKSAAEKNVQKPSKEVTDELARMQQAIGTIERNAQKQLSAQAKDFNDKMERERLRVNGEFQKMAKFVNRK